MPEQRSISRTANLAARQIFAAFVGYQEHFKAHTLKMQQRFEHQDWHGMHAVSAERIDLYTAAIQPLLADLIPLLDTATDDQFMWVSIKAVYSGLIEQRADWELAETFFNSVTRRIFTTVGVNPLIEFLYADYPEPPTDAAEPVYRSYLAQAALPEVLTTILEDYHFTQPIYQLAQAAEAIAKRLKNYLDYSSHPEYQQIDMIRSVFYRNKGAYLVGRVICGPLIRPMVLALCSTDQGIIVDAAIFEEREISILWSFTRSHFHVAIDRPYDVVQFMRSLLPRKPIAELYSALGHHKHGKTVLYRDLLQHLETSHDYFQVAKGERGMVMAVWTLPSYGVVFKVIKDRFAPPKDTTNAKVRATYRLVFRHDRAGRLVEAHEFEYLTLAKDRFEPALLDELCQDASQCIMIDGESVIIKHVYIERRITPLDIYLRESEAEAACAAVIEWGNAIKDLARNNIFPGDMLLKNFGVTRSGRVVFYDYDEICLLEKCSFRKLPEAQSYDDEMAAEPWFSVGPHDVFPEEFGRFLGLRKHLRQVFDSYHSDLLSVIFWKNVQKHLRDGTIYDIIPYSERQRLQRDT